MTRRELEERAARYRATADRINYPRLAATYRHMAYELDREIEKMAADSAPPAAVTPSAVNVPDLVNKAVTRALEGTSGRLDGLIRDVGEIRKAHSEPVRPAPSATTSTAAELARLRAAADNSTGALRLGYLQRVQELEER